VLVVGSIDPAAPLAPNFDARSAVDPYRLPPAPVEGPTDPGSNRLDAKHRGHLCLRAAIACVPVKEFLGSVIDRRTIVSRHLLQSGSGLGKATQPGLFQADPLHGAQPAAVERVAQVIQEQANRVDGQGDGAT
jgi:hypothetical protein